MSVKIFTAALTIFLYPHFLSQTFTLTFGFPNVTNSTGTVDPGPAPTLTGLSLQTFSASGIASNPSASGRFSFTGWPTGAINGVDTYSLFTGDLSPFGYYELALSPSTGYTLDLEALQFDVRRSSTGPRMYAVRSWIDGFAGNLPASTGTSTSLGVITDNVFFWKYDSASTSSDKRGSYVTTTVSHSAVTQPVFIRIYAWNAESASGSFSIDNFSLIGTLNSVTTSVRQITNTVPGLRAERSENGVSIRFPGRCTQAAAYDLQGKLLSKANACEVLSLSSMDLAVIVWNDDAGCHRTVVCLQP